MKTLLMILGFIAEIAFIGFIVFLVVKGGKEYIKDAIRWIIKEAKK